MDLPGQDWGESNLLHIFNPSPTCGRFPGRRFHLMRKNESKNRWDMIVPAVCDFQPPVNLQPVIAVIYMGFPGYAR
jgi:hypothetical protein